MLFGLNFKLIKTKFRRNHLLMCPKTELELPRMDQNSDLHLNASVLETLVTHINFDKIDRFQYR